MKKDRVTRWFVEPRDAQTNENAMMDLAAEAGATDDKIYRAKLDNEGEEHDVVEVDRSFVTRMENSAVKFQHHFRVFTQREGESKMRLWPFGDCKKLSQTAEVRRSQEELTRMLKRR